MRSIESRILSEIREILPGDVELATSQSQSDTAADMTRAFRLNLQALSLLGLLCGAFLIYNTMTFAVVQRRHLLATLRALGTTQREILTLILGEALVVGLLGVLLGELAGWVIGRWSGPTGHKGQSMISTSWSRSEVSCSSRGPFVKGAVVGLGTTTLAALAPAWEAGATSPRSAMTRSELESRAHRALPVASLIGVTLIGLGGLLLATPGQLLLPAFAGLFAVLMGLALLTPLATVVLMNLLTPIAGSLFGQLGRIATRGVIASLSRTGVAVAALMVALSVTVGVDLMIRSFRSTVSEWLEYTLPADLYISVFTAQSTRYTTVGSTLEPNTLSDLSALPEVDGANALRHFTASIDGKQNPCHRRRSRNPRPEVCSISKRVTGRPPGGRSSAARR